MENYIQVSLIPEKDGFEGYFEPISLYSINPETKQNRLFEKMQKLGITPFVSKIDHDRGKYVNTLYLAVRQWTKEVAFLFGDLAPDSIEEMSNGLIKIWYD